MKILLPITAGVLLSLWIAAAGAQEKVIVSHTTRGSLSIGPLLYGIDRGFYRDEGIDLVYVSIRADLGIKTLITGDVDYLYSVGTIIRGAVLGLPDESVLQSAIDEAKTVVNVTKPVSHADVVDYSFLRDAIKR